MTPRKAFLKYVTVTGKVYSHVVEITQETSDEVLCKRVGSIGQFTRARWISKQSKAQWIEEIA